MKVATLPPPCIDASYRGWILEVSDSAVVGKKDDGSGERFEIKGLPDSETALRMGKNKVDRLEGQEVWQ